MSNKILYSYHTDPHNPYRVITIARQLDASRGCVTFAIAVCRPLYTDGRTRDPKGEPHNKKVARELAASRLRTQLTNRPFRVWVRKDQHPLEEVLTFLAEARKQPIFLRRTAMEELHRLKHLFMEAAPMGAVMSIGTPSERVEKTVDISPVRTGGLAV